MTGLMAMAFMGLAGINLRNPTPKDKVTLFQEYQQLEAKNLDQ